MKPLCKKITTLAVLLGISLIAGTGEAGAKGRKQQDDDAVNCEELREKAGKLCNSLHPEDDKEFDKCFREELDPRCR